MIARDPICTHCHQRPSTVADHTVNLMVSRKDDRLVTDEEMRGMCGTCHDAKTARESHEHRPSRQRPPERHPGDV